MDGIIHDFISYNIRVVRDFEDMLRRALPADELEQLQSVAAESSRLKMPLYMVGGLPRDLVLGRVSSDYDLVVEGDAIQLARRLAGKFGGGVTAHSKFGTAKWSLDGLRSLPGDWKLPRIAGTAPTHVDLATARREVYRRPGTLPEVRRGSIQDDLGRRDFSINTLAIRLDGDHFGEVRDEFDALEDISNRIIRVLHSESFRDDPTRMYRAVRYEQRLGFSISPDTAGLIAAARVFIRALSGQRVRHELDLILEEEHRARMVRRLSEFDLLSPVSRTLPATEAALERLALDASPFEGAGEMPTRQMLGWVLWLLEVMPTKIQALDERLHFKRNLSSSLRAAHRIWHDGAALSRWKNSRITTYLDEMPVPAICAVSLGTKNDKVRRALRQYLSDWRHVRPSISGHDLKRMGVAPGPIYERILTTLRAGWLDGIVTNKAEERARLDRMLRHHRVSRGAAKRSSAH
jgi:tRNA nucleotidyltransferase (CCA-adding enzyme)